MKISKRKTKKAKNKTRQKQLKHKIKKTNCFHYKIRKNHLYYKNRNKGEYNTAQKMKFPLKNSSVNVTKSAGNCGFGHIYWRKSLTENFVFCSV